MVAKLINGTAIAQEVLDEVAARLKETRAKVPGFSVTLAVVQVGNRSDSTVYISKKLEKAKQVGVQSELSKLGTDCDEFELESVIERLNNDPHIDGIIVQLPLDTVNKIDVEKILDKIRPEKDVDGLTRMNVGKLARGELDSAIVPCTPFGCLRLVQKATGDDNFVQGKRVVVLGRSKIVGAPAAALFTWNNGTTTLCHSRTQNIAQVCREADILIVAIGQKQMIRGDWIKPGAVVIDCGINVEELSNGKRRLFGDVNFDEAKEVAGYITPVPGGVGPMTVAMLIRNTVEQAISTKLKLGLTTDKWSLQPLELHIKSPVPSDISISRMQTPKPIDRLAFEIGIRQEELEAYGHTKAKVSLKVLERFEGCAEGKYVVVAGINPTPLGEGKSTTTIGLAQCLSAHLGKNTFACVRQPSQGPTFGVKGGAAGGGYSQVIPMEEFNLHLTGDIHAISQAHNLIAAALDARIFHEATQSDTALFNRLAPKNKEGKRPLCDSQRRRLARLGFPDIDDGELLNTEQRRCFSRLNLDVEGDSIFWNRVVDLNDRFLRRIEIGHGPQEKGHVRNSEFAISVSSELMAILALCTSFSDLRDRIRQIVVGNDRDGNSVTVDDLCVAGAVAILMKDTVKPNLMQTLEGTPVFVHAGPFANIAHGNSSILADRVALKLVGSKGFVITEAGFGADIGMEKFFNIKCRSSGLLPNAVVIVATVRALKMHGGGPAVVAGSPLPFEYLNPNVDLVRAGCSSNLRKQVENAQHFGVPVVVCLNRFGSDSEEELAVVVDGCKEQFGVDAVVSEHWAMGGKGAIKLAKSLINACAKPSNFKFLYSLDDPIEQKMRIIAQKIYGANDIEMSPEARKKAEQFCRQGFLQFPVCMAKTHLSLSHDPTKKGAPKDFILPIRDVRISVGAGFFICIAGEIVLMPGLATRPCFFDMDIDPITQVIEGLF
uniref:C-1-tetrahydrofolate synthase, cytoplasmic n=2 Tax=Meloidogyne TaxID=189290 RepID=A0A914KZS2_MELIC